MKTCKSERTTTNMRKKEGLRAPKTLILLRKQRGQRMPPEWKHANNREKHVNTMKIRMTSRSANDVKHMSDGIHSKVIGKSWHSDAKVNIDGHVPDMGNARNNSFSVEKAMLQMYTRQQFNGGRYQKPWEPHGEGNEKMKRGHSNSLQRHTKCKEEAWNEKQKKQA